MRKTTGGEHPRLWSFAPPVLFTGHQLLNYWHYLLHRLVSFVFLPKIYCIVDCCMAMQQLLCRDAAIALSRCSNELPSRNRATERIKKAVISLLSGKSTEPKVDDSQGAKDHRRRTPPSMVFRTSGAFYRTPIIELLTLPSSSSRFICLFAKDILHSWLLHGDAAIALSPCSNCWVAMQQRITW